jgi:hypothetical protein
MVFERQKLLVDVRFFETGDIGDYLFFETLTYLRRTHSNLIVSQAGVRMSSTNELADMNRPPDLLTSEKRTFVSRITSIGAFLIEEYQGLHGRLLDGLHVGTCWLSTHCLLSSPERQAEDWCWDSVLCPGQRWC